MSAESNVVRGGESSPERARPRVVIIGGGFGGLACARRLAKVDVDVVLVDRENHHLFQPLLYQVATASLAPGSIAVPIRGVIGRSHNTRVLLGRAHRVDVESKELLLRDGERLGYDYLVTAVGSKTHYFGNDQWAEHAHGLKSLREALQIREQVLLAFERAERSESEEVRRRHLTFVVIGGGPTGVEMAGAISELARDVLSHDHKNIHADDIRVILVELAPRVLGAFHEELSASAQRQLEELGVEIRLGQPVSCVDDEGVMSGDERLAAEVVVWASGVKPAGFVNYLPGDKDRGGRVVVDRKCAIPAHPELFAIGDCASFTEEGAERPLPGVAPVAVQQGKYVADLIADEVRGKDRESRREFRYRDKGIMATVGRSRAVMQAGKLRMSGFLAWLAWGLIHVAFLVGFRNRAIVMFNWIWSYLTIRRGARLVTRPMTLQTRTAAEVRASDAMEMNAGVSLSTKAE